MPRLHWSAPSPDKKEPEIEEQKKCRLGVKCGSGYPDRCKYHEWKRDHDEAYPALIITGIFIIALTGIGLVALHDYDVRIQPIEQIIEGLGCNDLAEYVADYKSHYSYAEHRYEWLCVNEQIKEFQG